MKQLNRRIWRRVVVCGMFLSFAAHLHAWEPNAEDLDVAIKAGNFTGHFTNLTNWLNERIPTDPGKITEAGMKELLKDPVFIGALVQRQFIAALGVDNAGAFVRVDSTHKDFLDWLMEDTQEGDYHYFALPATFLDWVLQNTEAMDLCLLSGGAPSTKSLDVWRKLVNADPESKEGIYLKLAIAVSLSAPSGASHWIETPTDPVLRYELYKSAHKNSELLPIFDTLTVWEYRRVVSSWASDRELVWARKMLNTWRPDLREEQRVHKVVSEVWRRNSPFGYGLGGFKTVLAGGGKCGGRSWFGMMICHAFGIPSIGVGSPGHASMTYKAADGDWKTAYSPAWEKCKIEGLRGPDFLAKVHERSHIPEFSHIQHLQWLASALRSKESADTVTAIADKIRESISTLDPVRIIAMPKTPIVEEPPFEAKPGVIHIEAETFNKSLAQASEPGRQKNLVHIYDCYAGGKQVNFQKNMNVSWIEYPLDVPEPGVYGLTMRVAAVNYKQVLEVSSGKEKLATIKIPNTTGLWQTTDEVDIRLEKGLQTLRFSAPYQRGIALRWLELKLKRQ